MILNFTNVKAAFFKNPNPKSFLDLDQERFSWLNLTLTTFLFCFTSGAEPVHSDIHLSCCVSSFCLSLTLALTPFLVFCFSVSDLMLSAAIFFLCGLSSHSLVSLSDPCWTCLAGHLSLSFSHSFAPTPSTSLSVCLLQTEQPLRASSFKPFCVAAFQPPWSWLPLLIYAHCLCLTLSFSSHFPSCSLSLSLIFPSIYALSRLRQLLLFLSLSLSHSLSPSDLIIGPFIEALNH